MYSQFTTTDINNIATIVFWDDTQISVKIYSLQRPIPPPANVSINTIPEKLPNEIPNSRMREIIKDLQEKSFANKKHIYEVFKDYDRDKDGYVSYTDMKEQFKNLSINATDEEINKFIELADPNNNGYFNFTKFSCVITPNMVDQLSPLPDNEENNFYRRNRINVLPTHQKLIENMNYHKTYQAKLLDLREQFTQEKNMIRSICYIEM